MRRFIMRFVFLVCNAYLLSGCSIFYHFVLINKSKETLVITYQVEYLKNDDDNDDDRAVFHLPLRYGAYKTYTLPHTFDERTNTITFSLPPKKRAVIGSAYNTTFESYADSSVWGWKCNLDHIQIQTSKKELYYTIPALKQLCIENRTYRKWRTKIWIR